MKTPEWEACGQYLREVNNSTQIKSQYSLQPVMQHNGYLLSRTYMKERKAEKPNIY